MTDKITSWAAHEGTGSLDLTKVPTDILYAALRAQGHYAIVTLSAEDVMSMMDKRKTPCTEQEAADACHDVWWKGDYGDDHVAALEWACEIADENREEGEGLQNEAKILATNTYESEGRN